MYTGPHLIKDNLVFGYDTGYGVADNSTPTRFYPGKPTTNLYTNSDFSNGETGWTFGSWDGNISHTATTIVGPNGKTVSANRLTVNAASSYSHFHQYNGSKYTSGNTYTTSAWVKGQGTFQIKSHWGGNTSFTMTGDWQRVSMTVTATTSTNGNFPYFAGEGLTVGSIFYITDAQTELGGHATPYVYSGTTNGTRSSTQSIIDLKRTTNINVSNISFDSTGQPTFDGTDDIVNTGLFSGRNPATDPFTIEAIVKSDTTSGNHMWVDATNNGSNQRLYCAHASTGTSTPLGIQNSGWSHSIPQDTDYHHYVIVMDGSVARLYNNGEAHSTKNYTSYQIQALNVGGRSGYRWVGTVPMFKIHNQVLTADQVKQNYNAYKSRFGI